MKAGGIVLIVIAVLLFGATLFFAYFSWANFGSAGRLTLSLPAEAQFAVAIVRSKAEKQAMMAGGSLVGFLLFLVPGLLLMLKGKKKNQPLQSAPAGY